MQDVNISLDNKAGRIGHKGFGNKEGVYLIRLGLTDVISTETGRLERVQDTDLIKIFNKIVVIVCRRFQSNDKVVYTKRF